ncbi:hypothetical protein ACHQJC_17495 [Raoultella planticola]|uniref:hypothetical protein n=1 Tax=Raoultella planticola TaxID=575 RepID=UPI00389067AA
MKTFVGLDVSQKKTSICVIGHNGDKIRMANIDTHLGVIADYLFSEGFDKSKVGKASAPGAEGLSAFPWINGARLPDQRNITGSLSRLSTVNFTKPHLLRAVVERVTFNLCRGIDIFRECDLHFGKINIIGGGANNPT